MSALRRYSLELGAQIFYWLGLINRGTKRVIKVSIFSNIGILVPAVKNKPILI